MTDSPENAAWQKLQAHSEQFRSEGFSLGELIRNPAGNDRSFPCSVELDSLLFDFSRNYLNDETLKLLLGLAAERDVPTGIAAMFAGEKINSSEQRAAQHVALREQDESKQKPEVRDALERMDTLVNAVQSGQWRGHSGEPITDVVNIGIGGSDLGPAMAVEALKSRADGKLNVHFVSNVDPSHLNNTLAALNPATTLFIVASKSFGTVETLENAKAARAWLLQSANEKAVAKHFVAVSSNRDAATGFGIDEANVFPLWDWVGGRYSMWSAIGLPIALAIGMDGFRELLAGAHTMDRHFAEAPLDQNIPVLMALLSLWYGACFQAHSHVVVPYCQDLAQFPSFLQQLTMESLGKSVQHDGSAVTQETGTVTWGSTGSNGQHSYFQLLHQGTGFIPVDLIAIARPTVADNIERQHHLLASCFSQAIALMDGTPGETDPHKRIPGNKPSNVLLFSELSPHNLGMLVAAYEHKTYVQALIWNINAFDQWGVELGKKLSSAVFAEMESSQAGIELDESTTNLIAWTKKNS